MRGLGAPSRRCAVHPDGECRRKGWRGHRPAGQALVEFAIVLIPLMLVMLFTVDFGRLYSSWVTLNNLSRIGANYAGMHPEAWYDSTKIAEQATYRTLIQKDANGMSCTLDPIPNPTFTDASNPDGPAIGTQVKVDLSCKFSLVTPFISAAIGDSDQKLTISASSVFTIRVGSVGPLGAAPSAQPTITPTPTPSPTPVPTPTDPGATPTPTPTPTGPIQASFYGTPAESGYNATALIGPHSQGGGPGSNSVMVAWNWAVPIHWTVTESDWMTCNFNFGAGTTGYVQPSNAVNYCWPWDRVYTHPGDYTVTMTTGGGIAATPFIVHAVCQVPDFHGVKKQDASGIWTAAGFTASNLTISNGGGSTLSQQSQASGLLNPSGGCAGAKITVGG